jgi:uncharacterized repeat protein (TIGR01451 family)/CSLREA domain-containing protein
MSRSRSPRTCTLLPILLVALAGCQDISAPLDGPLPQFAQGDDGVWTVNTLADPGDGTCDDTECTLREAMAAAASGDWIVVQPGLAGTILLSNSQSLTSLGKTLTIDGDARITIDAQGNSPVMQFGIVASANITLLGLTLVNGTPGIAAGSATLMLDNVTVSDNTSTEHGAGLRLSLSTATIRNSTFSSNHAAAGGGGIFVGQGSSLRLIDSTLDGNEADDLGGGIFSAGTLDVSGSTISNNRAGNNGGGVASDGTAAIVLSTISGNHATASTGGGIRNRGSLQLRSATVTRNQAGQAGGGIFGGEGNLSTANSIIAGNTAGVIGNDCAWSGGQGVITSLGHNLSTGCASPSAPSDIIVTSAQIFTQVLDQTLADNGGPTKTHALIPRGLAVDAGYCPGETADQRGFPRPVDDPIMPNALDGCDIGAYELQGAVVPVADLIVSQTVDKTSVKQGDLLTYTVRVRNLGPQTAPNVVLTNTLSSGVTFVEARLTKGTHTAPPNGETGVVTWYVGDMLDQDNEVAEIEVKVLVRGKTTITNTAAASADAVDPNEANNTSAITVTVAQGSGGGGGGKNKK